MGYWEVSVQLCCFDVRNDFCKLQVLDVFMIFVRLVSAYKGCAAKKPPNHHPKKFKCAAKKTPNILGGFFAAHLNFGGFFCGALHSRFFFPQLRSAKTEIQERSAPQKKKPKI